MTQMCSFLHIAHALRNRGIGICVVNAVGIKFCWITSRDPGNIEWVVLEWRLKEFRYWKLWSAVIPEKGISATDVNN